MGGKQTLLSSCLSWSVVTARSSGTKMMTSVSIHCTKAVFSSALPVALSGKSVQTWESSYEHGEVPLMLLCTRGTDLFFLTSIYGNKSSVLKPVQQSRYLLPYFSRVVPGGAGAWTLFCGHFWWFCCCCSFSCGCWGSWLLHIWSYKLGWRSPV